MLLETLSRKVCHVAVIVARMSHCMRLRNHLRSYGTILHAMLSTPMEHMRRPAASNALERRYVRQSSKKVRHDVRLYDLHLDSYTKKEKLLTLVVLADG